MEQSQLIVEAPVADAVEELQGSSETDGVDNLLILPQNDV